MTAPQNPRVTQALVAIESALIEQTGAWLKEGGCFNDAINFALDLTVSVQDALELAHHREAAEAASKAREAALVEALGIFDEPMSPLTGGERGDELACAVRTFLSSSGDSK